MKKLMLLAVKKNVKRMISLLIVVLVIITMFTPSLATDPIYNPGDIAVINAIIDNNHLNWTKADPADGSYVPSDWAFSSYYYIGAAWSEDAANKRITGLYISDQSLTGILDVSDLTSLRNLFCGGNSLTELNVSGLTNLYFLSCENNLLTELALNTDAPYWYIDVSGNYIPDINAITGRNDIPWDTDDFYFLPQKDIIREPLYNPGDIAVINAVIDNNHLNWTKADPADGSYVPGDWTDVTWSGDETNKQIVQLFLYSQSLTGTLRVTDLASLIYLNCSDNSLTELDVSGCINLNFLGCSENSLTELDVSDLANLQQLYCSDNDLTKLVLNVSAPYEVINVTFNYMADTSAVVGRNDISWDTGKDTDNFYFSPQKNGVSYSITGKVISVAGDARPATVTLKQNGNIIDTAYTNQNGEYVFNNVAPGVYTIVITKASYLSYTKNLLEVIDKNIEYKNVTLTPGDINGDGYVNYNDFLIFLQNYNKQGANIANTAADINGDGYVDYNDFITFLSGYGKAAVSE